jgi:CheY-like chemotaxis protein
MPRAEPLLVLIADDDEDMRAFAVEILRGAGCDTLEARDGQEIVEMLHQSADRAGVQPDVLVTDVKMPRLSGLGVLEVLRRARFELPVVVMTVMEETSIRTIAQRLGAASVLRKPFEPLDLVVAVRGAKQVHALRHQS